MDQEEMTAEIVSTELTEIAAMPQKETTKESQKRHYIYLGILALVALISIFIFGGIASDPGTYIGINETLDEKKGNVMALVATTTSASAAISLLPDDMGSSIADKLADFSTYFLVILAVIYLEKFLLTTLGTLSFCFLIPISCAMFGASIFRKRDSLSKVNLQKMGMKFASFGLALAFVVPVSVWVTDNIDASFEESINASNAAAMEATQELEENLQESEQEEQGIIENIIGAVRSGIDSITQSAKNALDSLGRELNNMVDTLAVMIVTSCLIPLIVLALFLQIAKMISGIDYGGVSGVMDAARYKRREFTESFRVGNSHGKR